MTVKGLTPPHLIAAIAPPGFVFEERRIATPKMATMTAPYNNALRLGNTPARYWEARGLIEVGYRNGL